MPEVVIGEYSFDSSEEIGKGRYSTVYQGRHASGTKVAVKKVNWTALGRGRHDNIVRKLQQALAASKGRKENEHIAALLDLQVCVEVKLGE